MPDGNASHDERAAADPYVTANHNIALVPHVEACFIQWQTKPALDWERSGTIEAVIASGQYLHFGCESGPVTNYDAGGIAIIVVDAWRCIAVLTHCEQALAL